MNSMIEQIARRLCEAAGYDPDIIGLSGNPRWWLYTRTAEHTIPLLTKAFDEGRVAQILHDVALSDAEWADAPPPAGPLNPYRQEPDA